MSRSLRTALALIAVLAVAACGKTGPSPEVVAAGKTFLEGNAHAPGVHVTPSGLQYKVIASGPADGLKPRDVSEVKVNYEGKLLDGTVFDSSYQRGEPAVFGVSGLIPAWTEALQMMRPGDVWELYVPAKLGYGDQGQGPIPPGAVLTFKIELISIGPTAAGGA